MQPSVMHCSGPMESEYDGASVEALLRISEIEALTPIPTHSYYDRTGAVLETLTVHEVFLKVHRHYIRH